MLVKLNLIQHNAIIMVWKTTCR